MIETFHPEDWEIVFSGRGPLLPPRSSKPDPTWEPERRAYTKRSEQQYTLAYDEDNNELTASAVLTEERGRDGREEADGRGSN